MARVRMLKPGFFENAKLAKLPPHDRLLFAGLWTIADKRGRLKDNVKSIAGAIFPHENVNVERSLKNLDNAGFINRYEIDDDKVIQIVNFEKHQTPHYKEAESRLPPAPLPGQDRRQSLGLDPGRSRVQSRAEYGIRNTEYGSPEDGIPGVPPLEPSEQNNIYRATERMFNRPLSPVECDGLREMETDYPEETWRYAIREAGELNKRSLRYMQSVCKRVASGEDSHDQRYSHGAATPQRPAAEDTDPQFKPITVNLD